MLSHSPNAQQMNFLFPDLFDQLDVKDPLLLLSKSIPWEDFEKEFAGLYSKKDQQNPFV